MITKSDLEKIFLAALTEEIDGKESEIRNLKRTLDEKEHDLFVDAAASVIRRMVKVVKDAGLKAEIDCLRWNYTISDGKRRSTFSARTLNTE